MAAVTVASTDVANFVLQGYITNLGTQITAANTAGNGALVAQLTALQVQAQIQLVQSLLACGSLSASSLLAGNAPVYVAPSPSAGGAL